MAFMCRSFMSGICFYFFAPHILRCKITTFLAYMQEKNAQCKLKVHFFFLFIDCFYTVAYPSWIFQKRLCRVETFA